MSQSLSSFTSLKQKNNTQARHKQVTETISELHAAVDPARLTLLSNKSLEEVKALQKEIASVVPVGNVAGLVLSGLTRLKGHIVPPGQAQRDIVALMRGLEMVPKFLSSAVFASPAAVLYAYQKMLALAGKDVNTAFPDGLWQFYLEFSMRGDAAHHTNETNGFYDALTTHQLKLSLSDQLAAWVAAVVNFYFQYNDLLLTEWREATYLRLLIAEANSLNLGENSPFNNLKKKWLKQKPFHRGQDSLPTEFYFQYRQRKFDDFCKNYLDILPRDNLKHLQETYQTYLQKDAVAFQKQLSILTTLDPERYKEVRRSIPLWQARVAIIWQDEYHLLPTCAIDNQGNPLCFNSKDAHAAAISLSVNEHGKLQHPHYGTVVVDVSGTVFTVDGMLSIGQIQPLPIHQLRNWVEAIITGQYASNLKITHFDTKLLVSHRSKQVKARKKLAIQDLTNLEMLKMTPVIINWDERNQNEPLGTIRLGRRGVGDHALTIFRTASSHIFDLCHLFFDGLWGLATAEVLTGEAISWAAYLAQLPPLTTSHKPIQSIQSSTLIVTPESSVESTRANLPLMMQLRRNLLQRDPTLAFTINDLLVLYRTLFNREYRFYGAVQRQVKKLAEKHPKEANAIQESMHELTITNPVLLIPIDATYVSPRDRLYPVTFWNPMPELLDLFYETYDALATHKKQRSNDSWRTFNQLRTTLIKKIHYFGRLMEAHKEATLAGRNQSIATLKLLGHLPIAVQKTLEQFPEKFDGMNEMLRGEEVFSNVGRVASGSSLSRFISARDDNDAKTMVWGFLTDDQGVLNISLRDFRSEVIALFDIDYKDLAQLITQDFLDSFVTNFNTFVDKLNQIAASDVGEML